MFSIRYSALKYSLGYPSYPEAGSKKQKPEYHGAIRGFLVFNLVLT